MTRDERAQARLALGAAAILTVVQAAELLPWSDATSRAWLRKRGLVHHHPELGEGVVWGDVLEAFRDETRPTERARPATLPRKNLREET